MKSTLRSPSGRKDRVKIFVIESSLKPSRLVEREDGIFLLFKDGSYSVLSQSRASKGSRRFKEGDFFIIGILEKGTKAKARTFCIDTFWEYFIYEFMRGPLGKAFHKESLSLRRIQGVQAPELVPFFEEEVFGEIAWFFYNLKKMGLSTDLIMTLLSNDKVLDRDDYEMLARTIKFPIPGTSRVNMEIIKAFQNKNFTWDLIGSLRKLELNPGEWRRVDEIILPLISNQYDLFRYFEIRVLKELL